MKYSVPNICANSSAGTDIHHESAGTWLRWAASAARF